MTAVVVAENIDLRRTVAVNASMLSAYGTTKGLVEGQRYRVVELFYPLLTESSNDAAEAVAGFLGREKTIRLMNTKTKALLMDQTTYVDPSGLSLGNMSSAQDLFVLGRYIYYNRPPLFEITQGNEVEAFGSVRFSLEELTNKNVFSKDSNFLGGKTGYLAQTKYNELLLFRFSDASGQERILSFVLLGSLNLEDDTQKIYEWLKENFSLHVTQP